MDKVAFGAALRRARRRRFWSQEELANKLGMTEATVNRWEKGKQEPDLAALKKLERVFGKPLEETLGIKLEL